MILYVGQTKFNNSKSRAERGASLVEYAILLTLLCTLTIASVREMGYAVNGSLSMTAEHSGFLIPGRPGGPDGLLGLGGGSNGTLGPNEDTMKQDDDPTNSNGGGMMDDPR